LVGESEDQQGEFIARRHADAAVDEVDIEMSRAHERRDLIVDEIVDVAVCGMQHAEADVERRLDIAARPSRLSSEP